MTVLEVIQRSTEFLARKGVDSPRLQSELLLAHLLEMPRMNLYLNFERQLAVAEQDRLREMVKRRGEREPLQHIIGSTCFCGLELEVSRAALVPRPETELLAEQGWNFLNRRTGAPGAVPHPTALDFGTGTGCVAIAIGKHSPAARVVAVDIDAAAIDLAMRNAARHDIADRVEFVISDGFSGVNKESRFDLIVSNPPYIASAEIAQLEPEVRDFDPRRALDGGAEGLDLYRMLAAEAGAFLNPGGQFMVEFGDGQETALTDLFQRENWVVEKILKDYTQRPRILIARKSSDDFGSSQTTHG